MNDGGALRTPTVLRVVSLVSRQGRYGGPSESALRQAQLAASFTRMRFAAGHFQGDAPAVEGNGAAVVLFGVHPLLTSRPLASAWSFKALKEIVREVASADLVHVSVARELLPTWSMAVAIAMRRHLVAQPHGMLTSGDGRAQRLVDIILGPMMRSAGCVVALTDVEKRALERRYRLQDGRCVVVHNPIVREPTVGSPQDQDGVLCLGRIHRRKRVSVFVEAARVARSNGWMGDYRVVGPIEDRDCDLDALGPHYEGVLAPEAVPSRVARSAVFVLPARDEPWGNVLALALASGRPVVVTESAAMAPAIRRYGAGIIVPDEDAVALAQAVHSILADEHEYRSLSAGAQALAEHELGDDYQIEMLRALYGVDPLAGAGP